MQGTTNSPKKIYFHNFVTLRLFMILANIPIAYLINSRFGAKRKLITSYIHDISSSTQWIKIIYYERRPRTIYHSRAIVANVFLLKTHVTAHIIYVCSSTALVLPCSICYSCIFCSKLQEYCKKIYLNVTYTTAVLQKYAENFVSWALHVDARILKLLVGEYG